jgi:hypothetical protein
MLVVVFYGFHALCVSGLAWFHVELVASHIGTRNLDQKGSRKASNNDNVDGKKRRSLP